MSLNSLTNEYENLDFLDLLHFDDLPIDPDNLEKNDVSKQNPSILSVGETDFAISEPKTIIPSQSSQSLGQDSAQTKCAIITEPVTIYQENLCRRCIIAVTQLMDNVRDTCSYCSSSDLQKMNDHESQTISNQLSEQFTLLRSDVTTEITKIFSKQLKVFKKKCKQIRTNYLSTKTKRGTSKTRSKLLKVSTYGRVKGLLRTVRIVLVTYMH